MVVKDLEKMKWTELKGAQRASALPPNPSTPPLALLCAEETFQEIPFRSGRMWSHSDHLLC